MEQTLLIGIQIGFSSAAASIGFSGSDQTPTVVTWGRTGKVSVPIRSSTDEEGSFKWGHGLASMSEAPLLFAMNLWSSTEPLEDDSFYRILRTRNGELCYDSPNTPNTPSHEYQRMCEMEYKLKVIFGELKQHIDAFVVKKYTRECLSLPRRICAVMPSFLTYERRSNFERLVLDIFGQSTVSFVTQPEADLAWYTFKTPLQANRGDYVIFCHADEEITTISRFQVGEQPQTLTIHSQEVKPVGSDTIKEALLGILVKKSVSSGIRDYLYLVDQQIFLDWVQTELLKFVSQFDRYRPEKPFNLRYRNNAGDIISFSLPPEEVEELIHQVLDSMLSKILPANHLETLSNKFLVLLSGHLGEFSYVHSRAKDYFRGMDVVILPSRDEATSCCQGAVIHARRSESQISFRSRAEVDFKIIDLVLDNLFQDIDAARQTLDLDWSRVIDLNSRLKLLSGYRFLLVLLSRRERFGCPQVREVLLDMLPKLRLVGSVEEAQTLGTKFLKARISQKYYQVRFFETNESEQLVYDRNKTAAGLLQQQTLHAAIAKAHSGVDHYRVIEEILEEVGRKVFDTNFSLTEPWNGATILSRACQLRNLSAVKLLLGNGADPNEDYDVTQVLCHCSPLCLAIENESPELVELLLQRGADVNRVVVVEEHPLAASFGIESECKLCAGRDTRFRGFSATFLAIYRNEDVFRAILERSPDLKATTHITEAALKQIRERHEITEEDMALFDQGITPLALLARDGNISFVEILLDHFLQRSGRREMISNPSMSMSDVHLDDGYLFEDIQEAHYHAKVERHSAITNLLEEYMEKWYSHKNSQISPRFQLDLKLYLSRTFWKAFSTRNEPLLQHLLSQCSHVAFKFGGQTLLGIAIEFNLVNMAKEFLRRGVNVNALSEHYLPRVNVHKVVKYKSRCTALHLATAYGSKTFVKLLLQHGADVNAKGVAFKADLLDNFTALHLAAGLGYTRITWDLMNAGSDPSSLCEPLGHTALEIAADKGHWSEMQAIMANFTPRYTPDLTGYTALHHAAHELEVSTAKLFSPTAVEDSQSGRVLLNEPVHLATDHGTDLNEMSDYRVLVLSSLLQYDNSMLNARDHDGNSPLHLAARAGCVRVLKFLVMKGALIDARNHQNMTPLLSSLQPLWGFPSLWVVERLFKAGANPLLPDMHRRNAHDYLYAEFFDFNRYDISELLSACAIRHLLVCYDRAEPNQRDEDGRTSLHHAALSWKYYHVVENLLEQGANANMTDAEGDTALHTASWHGNYAMVKLLLKHKADPMLTNKKGYTPLHEAAQEPEARPGHIVIDYLMDAGAKVDVWSSVEPKVTPLLLLCMRGFPSIHRIKAAKELIRHGADIYAQYRGRTAIEMAEKLDSYAVNSPMATAMREAANMHNEQVKALHLGVIQNDIGTVYRILSGKVAAYLTALWEKRTILSRACERGRTVMITLLIEHGGDPNQITHPDKVSCNCPPLHWALRHQSPELVNLLITHGADVNFQPTGRQDVAYGLRQDPTCRFCDHVYSVGHPGSVRFRSPLVYALLNCSGPALDSIVEMLLTAGAVPNAADLLYPSGYRPTALSIACERGYLSVTRLLLNHGASVDGFRRGDCKPLDSAISECRDEIVSVLLDHGADPNRGDYYGFHPLYKALFTTRANRRIIELLVSAGANIRYEQRIDHLFVQNNTILASLCDDVSVIHMAVPAATEAELLACIKVLVENGANIYDRVVSGRTCIEEAKHWKFWDLVAVLETRARAPRGQVISP